MKNKNHSGASAFGIWLALQIVLLVLKLYGLIDCSWWWVFAPTWIVGCLVILFIIVTLVIAIIETNHGRRKP